MTTTRVACWRCQSNNIQHRETVLALELTWPTAKRLRDEIGYDAADAAADDDDDDEWEQTKWHCGASSLRRRLSWRWDSASWHHVHEYDSSYYYY
jgi:hypothetical protein